MTKWNLFPECKDGPTYKDHTSKWRCPVIMNQKTADCWGTWVAQLVKLPTLDFGSGHDLAVCEFKPHVRLCSAGVEPACDSFPPSLCPSPACAFFSLSLSLSE